MVACEEWPVLSIELVAGAFAKAPAITRGYTAAKIARLAPFG